jgi:hypothetical protein
VASTSSRQRSAVASGSGASGKAAAVQANEILRKASALLHPSGARPATEAMTPFIDEQRDADRGVRFATRCATRRPDPGTPTRDTKSEDLTLAPLRTFLDGTVDGGGISESSGVSEETADPRSQSPVSVEGTAQQLPSCSERAAVYAAPGVFPSPYKTMVDPRAGRALLHSHGLDSGSGRCGRNACPPW